MVYIMHFSYEDAIGAAAVVLQQRWKESWWTQPLPDYPTPTNQRAEIAAIILALEQAFERYETLHSSPYLELTIQSDSRYVVNCMNTWIHKLVANGWVNSAGNPVANRDLIEEASDLDDRVKDLASVTYSWIPRTQNSRADELCNEVLDDQE